MKLKHVYLAGAFATFLLVAACNKNNNDNTTTNPVNGQDTTYIVGVSKANRAEIVLGTMALTKSMNDSVKMFAQMMINDHTTAQTNLTNLADSISNTINLNDSLDADQIAMRNMLMPLSGSAFDSAYISGQITAHQKTLTIFDSEISGGQNTQVKNFATLNRPMIQMHLNMADSIYTKLP